MAETQPLIMRRHSRLDVSLRGKFIIAPEHSSIVRYAAAGPGGWIDADIIDLSSGGLAFMSNTFVPRRALLAVRILAIGESIQPIVELPLRVQRVQMTDRRPAYLIGGAFDKPSLEQVALLQSLISQFTS